MPDYFPEGVIMDIMIRLSIKSTVRFRCLSRSWRVFLSDPNFIYKNLILCDSNVLKNKLDLFVLRLDKVTGNVVYSFVSHETLDLSPVQDFPVQDSQYGNIHFVVSSTDGLICYCVDHPGEGTDIGVWNPATAEAKFVPKLDDHESCSAVGFGYDAQENDHKIVQLLMCERDDDPHTMKMEAYVYSLRGESSWRKLDADVPLKCNGPQGCFYGCNNGSVYWIGWNRFYQQVIVSFDMSHEEFRAIAGPEYDSGVLYGVCFLKDCLVTVVGNTDEDDMLKMSFEIWVLLEFGVDESWTKLYNIGWVTGLYSLHQSLGFWKNEFIFETCSGQLLMYDPSKQETKIIQMDGLEVAKIEGGTVWCPHLMLFLMGISKSL